VRLTLATAVNLPITGPSVVLRWLQPEDLADMYDMECDPEVKQYLDGPTRHPREEWIHGMESRLCRQRNIAVIARDTGQFAGRAALDIYGGSALTHEIQVVIARDYWGRHFGREASKILIDAAFDELVH